MRHYDEALEESPELLQQLDVANDLDLERPGKLEVVMGREPEEEEKDGGSWVVVETQRKTRKKPSVLAGEESRMGRLKRLFPTLLSPPNSPSLEELAQWVEKYGEEKWLRYQEEWEKKLRLQRHDR